MAQTRYRANLSAKSWPFISDYFGRSVIVGTASRDQNFNRQVYSSEDPDKDIGIPQIYYAHNVMPTSQGLQSIGYADLIPSPLAGATDFEKIYNLHYATGSAYLAIRPNGDAYTLIYGATPVWTAINNVGSIVDRIITVANISGESYVYISNVGCFKYNAGTNQLDAQVLTGLTAIDIIGIVGAVGYMIAWSATAVAWSSTIDPTDFTPSLITGAGGGGVEQAKGPLSVAIATSQGFIIYTPFNAVAAIYSGNARFPFNYRELASAGGVTSYDNLDSDTSDAIHFAFTTVGLQSVGANSSQVVFPDLTDFISGKVFEDFDESTNTFSYTDVVTMKKHIAIIGGRYLVISYGVTELTHAIVYDTAFKRFGKLKITHTEAFEWLLYPSQVTEIARQSLGFFKKDGSIVRVDFPSSDRDSAHNGVMILGKYQFVRARALTLEEVTVENVNVSSSFTLSSMVSYKGKVIDEIVSGNLDATTAGTKARTYRFHYTGLNHSLLFKGSFFATSIIITFTNAGDR